MEEEEEEEEEEGRRCGGGGRGGCCGWRRGSRSRVRWERGAWFVWWVGGGRDGGGGAVRKVQVVETSRRTPEEAIAKNS